MLRLPEGGFGGDRSQRHRLGIINDLLTLSRAEARRQTYEIGPLAIPEMVDAVLLMVAPQAESRGIGLESAMDPALALNNSTKVKQILLNLILNTVKFTTPGGRIRANGGAEDWCVRIHVRDTETGARPARAAPGRLDAPIGVLRWGRLAGAPGRAFRKRRSAGGGARRGRRRNGAP